MLKKKLAMKTYLQKQCDVSNENSVKDFVNFSVDKLKTVDIFINNAGIPSRGTNNGISLLDEVPDENIRKCVEINLLGSLYCSKYILKVFKNQSHGHLFEMEGFGSHNQVREGLTVYGMTKNALRYLGRSLANEYSKTNIGVHRIYPGLTITSFITNGNKANPMIAKLCNTIGDLPENVAKNLCPQILNANGTDNHFEHISQMKYAFLFATSFLGTRNKFFDNEGKFYSY